MKQTWKIAIGSLLLVIAGLAYWVHRPVDILSQYVEGPIEPEAYERGRTLIAALEVAYGGKENWLSKGNATFEQTADWYGRLAISHWDTLPQRYHMDCKLGTDECRLTLLNGPHTGNVWGHEGGNSYVMDQGQEKTTGIDSEVDKALFKNYWFQFPFRIGEAEIVVDLGPKVVGYETYDRVFATWGSLEANRDFDQFVLYINQDTRMVEYLHFTVRDAFPFMEVNARFTKFREIEGITLPFSQFVRLGPPWEKGTPMHENHYQSVSWWQAETLIK